MGSRVNSHKTTLPYTPLSPARNYIPANNTDSIGHMRCQGNILKSPYPLFQYRVRRIPYIHKYADHKSILSHTYFPIHLTLVILPEQYATI